MQLFRRNLLIGNFGPTAVTPPSAQSQLLHLLNRISYGPHPDDMAWAEEIGLEATLDEQLAPTSIDDSDAEDRLQSLPILKLDRRAMYGLSDYEYRTQEALVMEMLTRAIYSRRQLQTRLVEFWSDHFNIPANDEYNPDLILLQQQFRQHALGNFRDLLLASAKSPAMLLYLDNFVNVAGSPNENYARELLELHTLGVNGGYTEIDVKEVARAFTGWTIHPKARTGFYFSPTEHDTASKQILGHTLPDNRGLEDGLHVLSILAMHPATARFVCRKLAVRFVSDDPPDGLIDRLAAVWQQHGGQIKPVLRTLFLSSEFAQSAGQKLRRPLDFFIGAMRATGTEFVDTWRLQETLNELGQMPFGWRPPNGYPDTAAAWTNTNGMLARWNVAMRLTHAAYSDPEESWGLVSHIRERVGQPNTVGELVDAIALQIFGAPLPANARPPFIEYAANGERANTPVTAHLLARKLGSLYGLMLASPLYQWR